MLTHCRLNEVPHTLYGKNLIFDFRYVRLYDLEIHREKWLNYLQTMETLIRRRVPQRLMWVCTVCHLPFWVKRSISPCEAMSNTKYPISYVQAKKAKISLCYHESDQDISSPLIGSLRRNVRKHTYLHVRVVWSESSLSAWKTSASLDIQNVHKEDSDQTARMLRLIWIFAGAGPRSLVDRTLNPLGFSLLWFELCSGHMWESQVLLTDGFLPGLSGFRPALMNDRLK